MMRSALVRARRSASAGPSLARSARGAKTLVVESEAPMPSPQLRVADFRSDTVTKPTAQMTISMIDAQVGDDVYGEDPTVNELQRYCAKLCGKEAALFVPSCTMANLLSIGAWIQRGDEIILGDESHIFYYEQGGASALLGGVFHTLPNNDDGTLPLTGRRSVTSVLESRGGGKDPHFARPGMVAIENTHNRCGGTVLQLDYIKQLSQICKDAKLPLHMDGARVFNAAAYLGVPIAKVVADVDSVSVCLSKGLGAPIGALVVGPKDFIARARRLRKVVGGGMRQAGVIAAAGMVGLKEHAGKLGADHAKAKSLARGLAAIPGVVIDPKKVPTNIAFFDLDRSKLSVKHWQARVAAASAASSRVVTGANGKLEIPVDAVSETATTAEAFAALVLRCGQAKIGAYGDSRLRAVTHHQVSDDDVERLLEGATNAAFLLSAPQ